MNFNLLILLPVKHSFLYNRKAVFVIHKYLVFAQHINVYLK